MTTEFLNPDNLLSWPPVTEMKHIIQSLNSSKTSGEDFLPPELFKTHIDLWAPLLTGLFTCIDNTGQ